MTPKLDVDIYKQYPELYDVFNSKRVDYTSAIKSFIEFTKKYFSTRISIVLTDFCCWTWKNTKIISELISIKKAILIDINRDFLDIAKNTPIKAEVEIIHSDIISADICERWDLVLSLFAYHHVSDSQKEAYLHQAKKALKNWGYLLLWELYSPNKETTIKYYDMVLDSIPSKNHTPELKDFLYQTARSENVEFKVSREFAHTQLKDLWFVLIEAQKCRPNDDSILWKDVGIFIEMRQLQ